MAEFDRRGFLIGFARGAAATALSGSVVRRVASAALPALGVFAARPTLPAHAASLPPLETLMRPIMLRRGEVLADRRFTIGNKFQGTTVSAAIYVTGSDVTIRNVHLVGASQWKSRWNQYTESYPAPAGIPAGTSGIRLQNAPGSLIENVSIEGLPGAGIDGFGLDDAVIANVTARHCFHGVVTRHIAPNPRMLIQGVAVSDLWGPGPGWWPGVGGEPSLERRRGFTGGDGLSLHALRDSLVQGCSVAGEQNGSFKLVNPQRVEVAGLLGATLMVQGTSDLEWKIDKTPSSDTLVRDCTFDKSLASVGGTQGANGAQISWNVDRLRFERCSFVAAGTNGHGMQFAVDVHGEVVACTFDGFNGWRGVTPACALEVLAGCDVNPDFVSTNAFANQTRILSFG